MNRTGLSRLQWLELSILVGAGVALAIGSVVFRLQVPRLDVPLKFYQLQYRVGFIYLGLLLLLWVNSNTKMGRIGLTVCSLFLGLGLLVPPSLDYSLLAESSMYLILVFAFGVLHYRFNDPSNTRVIVLVLLLGLEFYLYGVWYVVRAFRETGVQLTVLGLLLLSVIMWMYSLILGHEINKVHDGTRTARYLGKVLYEPYENN